MRPAGLFLLAGAGAALMALAGSAEAQRAGNWRVYRNTDGLPESACSSVTLGSQGRVVARHPNAPFISELDGYTINTLAAAEAGNNRAYESPGGQLWCIVSEGLREFQDGTWVLHRVPEIAEQFRSRAQPPTIPLWPIRQGLVLVLLPERLMEFTSDGAGPDRMETLRSAAQSGLERFGGMEPAADGGLWLAGMKGLAKAPGPLRNLRSNSEWRDYLIPESLGVHNLRGPHDAGDAGVSAVADSMTNEQPSLVVFDGQSWSTHSTGSDRVRQAWRGSDRACWAMTPESLLQWEMDLPEIVENEDVSARQYFDAAVERGGAFWLATSDGLVRYAPSSWRTPGAARGLNSLIHCGAADQEGRLWFIAGGALHFLQNERRSEAPLSPRSARVMLSARALYALRNGNILIETGDGLFEFLPGTEGLRPLRADSSADRGKVLGIFKEGTVAIQRFPEASALELAVYDGAAFGPFPYPPPESAIGTNLTSLLVTQNGDLWVSGELGTGWYHEQKWRRFVSTDNSTPQAALGFVEMSEGKVWCAAQDRIWEFDGRNWSAVRRGFDRIQGLLRSRRDGSVWVASNNGIHRFAPSGAWVENGLEEGLPANSIRCVGEDSAGRLWAGTARGLSFYYPDADVDPPKTQIEPLPDSDKKILEGHTVTLIFSSQDRWKYTARPRLLYSYRLDTHDWSAFQDGSSVSLPDLPAGKHYFEVRAMDRNCNVEPKAAQLEFVIALPWYREKRLVMISAAGLVAVLFFAGLAFNRHHQLRLSYMEVEKQIAERTRELERANRELLHSQKMNALGALAAGIAHDFNNILSIVKGSAQIIEDNLENPDKIRTRVDRIKTVVEQGAGIVKAMLGFSRDSGQEATSCDLNAAVEDTIKLLGDRFLREVQVRFEPGPDLPEVACSKDFVQQILLNFIFNAAESMAERKDVIITTRPMGALPKSLVLAPVGQPPYAAISVQDHGCGIPPENLTRIFEPFFTTKALSSRRGTGLGLSMVYELAKKMQAGLAVESVVGQGSVFSLILPLAQAEAQPAVKHGNLVQKS
jgi:signal transduction histidine kinase/ligand-binding sensor domain-containing protein